MGKNSKTKDFPILFRENYEDWFRRAEVKIKGKEAYYSIELSKTEYVWIHREGGAAGDSKKGKTTTPTSTDISGVDNLTSKFEQIGGSWNVEQVEKWDQADVKALEIILKGLGPDDFILIDEYETAGAVWIQLKVKYNKMSAFIANQYLTVFYNFLFDKKVGIDGS